MRVQKQKPHSAKALAKPAPRSGPIAANGSAGSDDPLRTRILLKARETFDWHGVARVTMEEIARGLGISKKTLYKHFANKEELLGAVVRLHMSDAAQRMDTMMADADLDFIGRVERLMQVISIQAMSVSQHFLTDLAAISPELWQEVEAFREVRLRKFGGLLTQGIREGYIRPDIDVELVMTLFMTMIQSLVNPRSLLRSRYSFAQMIDGILTLVFEGVLTANGRNGIQVAGGVRGPQFLRQETLAMMLSPSLRNVLPGQQAAGIASTGGTDQTSARSAPRAAGASRTKRTRTQRTA